MGTIQVYLNEKRTREWQEAASKTDKSLKDYIHGAVDEQVNKDLKGGK